MNQGKGPNVVGFTYLYMFYKEPSDVGCAEPVIEQGRLDPEEVINNYFLHHSF